jgi:orotate phosphoribosyltransferase
MKPILQMNTAELLALPPHEVTELIRPEEFIHIAKELCAYWQYDYEAAEQGRVGMHALLKSGRHSDGFFVSKILLEPWNICYLMAYQIAERLRAYGIKGADYVTGIPDGASKLGEVVAWLMRAKNAELRKLPDGSIEPKFRFGPSPDSDESIILIEDFCTRGTGFIEAFSAVKSACPRLYVYPADPVMLNRGGLRALTTAYGNTVNIIAVCAERIMDWSAEECPLCKRGSKPIKPKATDENWHLITTSQLKLH